MDAREQAGAVAVESHAGQARHGHRLADGLAGRRVPTPDGVIAAARNELGAIGVECHGVRGEGRPNGLAGGGIPELDGTLEITAGDDPRAVGAEGQDGHGVSVLLVIGWPMGWPVAVSQSRMVASPS